MAKHKKKKEIKIGHIIRCQNTADMTQLINHFANKGIDAKPTGSHYEVEVVDIDKRRKRR